MIDHDMTMELIRKAQKGDDGAKEVLIKENTPLLKSIIKRYMGKGVEYDDLMQISSLGLLKAIQNFSEAFNVKFSTYAVPMILGEVKRFMRDDGCIKVSRSVKALSIKIFRFIESYKNAHDASPTIEEIASEFGIEPSEIVFAMDSQKQPISLYEKNEDDEKGLSLIDRLVIPNREDELIDRVILKTVIKELTPREKKIIILRYFRDMTQSEIAREMCVSQVQISRLENKILEKIKKAFNQ